MLSAMKPSRYESVHETGKRSGNSLAAVAVIESSGSLLSTERTWQGAIFGRAEGHPIAPHQVLVVAATADEARKQLAAALRKIADDLDQTQLP
jgi:hypothetical protein